MRINSGYKINGNGPSLYYEVLENGFDIYYGENATAPMLHQPEPYIPNPDISYEENAKKICEELGKENNQPFMMTREMYTDLTSTNETMRADLDYLLLLSE